MLFNDYVENDLIEKYWTVKKLTYGSGEADQHKWKLKSLKNNWISKI